MSRQFLLLSHSPLFLGVFFIVFSWFVAVPKAQAMNVSVTASPTKVIVGDGSTMKFSIQAVGATKCTLIEKKHNGTDWIETRRSPWQGLDMILGPAVTGYPNDDPSAYSYSKTLTCTDAAGAEQSSTATVDVQTSIRLFGSYLLGGSGAPLVKHIGESTLLYIASMNADYCVVSGAGSNWIPLNGRSSTPGERVATVQVTVTENSTYYATCFSGSPYGRISESKSVTINVYEPVDGYTQPVSYVTLSVNGVSGETAYQRPLPWVSVKKGEKVTLEWASFYNQASQCSAYQGSNIPYQGSNGAVVTSLGWTGSVPPSGSKDIVMSVPAGYYTFGFACPVGLQSYTGYTTVKAIDVLVIDDAIPVPAGCDSSCATRTCTGNFCQNSCKLPVEGRVECNISIPLSPVTGGTGVSSGGTPPTSLITSFTTNQATLATPGDITLTWRTSGAASCSASGDWEGNTPLSGSRTVPVTITSGTTAFHLECRSASSTDQKSVYVSVGNNCPPGTPSNACAADTCNTQTCPDGCGGHIAGTKDCGPIPGCIDDNSCAANKCKDETCTNNCNKTISGIKDCIAGGASTCQGTCRQSCLPNEEKAQVGLCATSAQTCCTTKATPPSGSSTTYASFAISNPLSFNTVDDVFTSLLSFFQAAIVLFSLIFILIGAFFYITSAGDDSRMETGKKAILASLIGLALGIAAPAFLKEIASILGWGNPTLPQGVGTSLSLLEIAENVLSFLLTIIGILAIIMLVVGGTFYLTAAGNEDQIDKGKKIITYSLIGILIALGSLVLVRQVAEWFG